MTNNMGTPAHPEGLPHFSVKALMAHKLGVALRLKPPRQYATFLPSEFREVSLDDSMPHDSMPHELKQALERVMERLDSRPPYSFVIFNEPPHGDCDGGVMVVGHTARLPGWAREPRAALCGIRTGHRGLLNR